MNLRLVSRFPLRRFRARSSFLALLPLPVASYGVHYTPESYRHRCSVAIRLRAPATASLFPKDPHGLPNNAGPYSFAEIGSSSHALRSPLESVTAANPHGLRHAPSKVSSLFATSANRVHSQCTSYRAPNGPPSAFLTLSAVYSSFCLVGLFHPTTTFRITPPGGFPATKAPCLATARPFMHFTLKPSDSEQAHYRRRPQPLLQGVTPGSDP
jgi:hypothetical protein